MFEEVRLPGKCSMDVDEKEHAFGLMCKLFKMREESKQCDLVIKIDGKELHTHRNVMIAGCDYFDAMFSHDNVECSTGVVHMEGVEFPAMQKIVDFLYTGKMSFEEGDCVPLLYAASMLQLTSICSRVADFLRSRLSVHSFFDTRRIAKMFNLDELDKSCDEYALKRLDSLVKEEEFNQLDEQYLFFLLSTKESISPGSEDSKLAIIIRWIKSNVEDRLGHFNTLLNVLDLTAISHEYGRYLAKNEKICYESGECMKMLYLSATRRVASTLVEAPAFISFSEPNALFIFNKNSNFVEAYRPGYNSWSRLHPLPEQWVEKSFTAAVCHEYLYILMAGKSVFRIAIGEDESRWQRMVSMKEDHGIYMTAAAHNESIFLAGGNALERFNTEMNAWEIIRTSSDAVCHRCTLVECNDAIYVIGGRHSSAVRNVSKLSVDCMTWSSVQPMNEARCDASAVSHNGKIFVAGGTDHGGTSVESYDVNCNAWCYIADMNNCPNGFNLCVASRKLFAVGSTGNSHSLEIEVYENSDDQWKVLDLRYAAEKKILSRATVGAFIPK